MSPWSAIGFLTVYNVVQNRFFNRSGYVVANLAVTGLGLGWARRSGLTTEELGLHRAQARRGLTAGAGISALAWAGAVTFRNAGIIEVPSQDGRLDDVQPGAVWFRLLVRFPVGTALFEEVWFRGLLSATLRRAGFRHPDLVGSAVFAAWHLIPTATALDANPRLQKASPIRRASLVLGGSVAAGLGGLVFVGLRDATGSLAAPWLTHAALNGVAFWSAWRRRLNRAEGKTGVIG